MAPRRKKVEKRIAADDGVKYTKDEFINYYGPKKGEKKWNAAEPAAASTVKVGQVAAVRRPGAGAQRLPPPVRLVGFDFDCTLTVKHFFKIFSWGYAQGNRKGHAHCEAFYEWCEKHDVKVEEHNMMQREADVTSSAVDAFCRNAGEDVFGKLFREVFLGGEERIQVVTTWLESMSKGGVEFAIVTAGVATTVVRALNAVPEWQKFFPSNRIWDTSQSRHSVRSIMGHKVLMLRDMCPASIKSIMIDDSLDHDPPPDWVLKGAQVEVVGLEYEGSGVDKAYLEDIQKRISS